MTLEPKTITAARALEVYLWLLVCGLAATAFLLFAAAIEPSMPRPVAEAKIGSAWAAEGSSPAKPGLTIASAAGPMLPAAGGEVERTREATRNSHNPSLANRQASADEPAGLGASLGFSAIPLSAPLGRTPAALNPAASPAAVEHEPLADSNALKTLAPAPVSVKSDRAVDRGDRGFQAVETKATARSDSTANRKLAQPMFYRRAAASHAKSAKLAGRPKSRSMTAYASRPSWYPPIVSGPSPGIAGCPAGSEPKWSDPDMPGAAVLICNPYYRRLSVDVY